MSKLTYLPMNEFLRDCATGYRQPDPVPRMLAVAVMLFVITALLRV